MNSCLRKKSISVTQALIIFASTSLSLGAQQAQETRGSLSSLALKGTLLRRHFPGAPGFGETPKIDGRVTVYILKLNRPIGRGAVPGLNLDKKLVSELQIVCSSLVVPNCQILLKKLVGEEIAISGHITEAIEPNEFLPFIIEPTSLGPAD